MTYSQSVFIHTNLGEFTLNSGVLLHQTGVWCPHGGKDLHKFGFGSTL